MHVTLPRLPRAAAPAPPPAPPPAAPAAVTLAELFAQQHATDAGLTEAEAARRRAAVGPNDAAPAPRNALRAQLLEAAANPLNLILLLAAGVSGVLGEPFNAGLIGVMVLLSIGLNFVQTYRSQQAADRLRSQVAPQATVRRDGAWVDRPRRDLVPGDVIRLAAGDLVPADARLITARDLHVQQAALTGESLPAEKEAVAAAEAPDPARCLGTCFLGTSIVSGTATALVVATGRATAFGDIAARLATRAPETEFERGTRRFGLFIMRTVTFLVLFVFLVSAALRHDPFESLLFAVALAVGLTPEFLPMITAVTLSRGAVHMARRQVIVKNLAAIQNFGSIDVLCSDKTGTITGGEMVLQGHVDPRGAPAEPVFLLAYLNSYFGTGVRDAVDRAILQASRPDPLDTAILRHDHPDVAAYTKVDEIPFDFERRRASVVVRQGDAPPLLISKGAPEGVLPACTAVATGEATTAPCDAAALAAATAIYQGLSAQGFRVLAVATRTLPAQPAYHAADETGLTLAGFVSFADPPLPDAAAALAALRADGVRVVILTGDNELVARHVCGAVGLDPARVVLGDAVATMTDPALGAVAEETAIFARVSPAQKDRIILALKNRGHVVGYIGDGINDAPSLHAADVGIAAVGGVDVAKDAASIILLAPGLDVLHNGILEGRRAFGNVMKYLLMGTSSNFGNMFSMAAAALFLPFLPMLPTQILLNNFLYDLAQVTIPSDNVDASFIRKPRHWDIGLIRDFMFYIGPISSLYDFLTFGVLLWILQADATLFHTGWFVESLATQTLVLFVIRTAGNPLRSRPSRPLTVTTLLIVGVACLLPISPLAALLGFTPLPPLFYVFVAGATVTYLGLVEVVKRRLLGRLLG